jgi:3-isopropylmalate/(R)-2-methylmalate dehydratase small subunit
VSAFQTLTAVAAPIEGLNVDTDQIIPARFLKFDRAAGYGQFLFHDLRIDERGAARPAFVLNRPAYRDARILAADENFGCGSSREGAVYALSDFGIRVVVAPSFGDIFYNNCLRNGLLPATVTAHDAGALRAWLSGTASPTITVDLPSQTIRVGATVMRFTLDGFWRDCLLRGVDEIGLALNQADKIDAFERDYLRSRPWLTSA